MKTILSWKRHYYMKRAAIFLIMVALIAGMVGCEPTPTPQYDLTIASTAGGSVSTPGEGTFTYDEGTVVNLMAAAEEGYRFVEWTGDVGTIANVNAAGTTITMNDSYSITANFEEIPPIRYNLTISSTTGGSVTAPGEGTFTYDYGTLVDLVATPDNGYQFVNWTGNVGAIADVYAAETTITINHHCSITANFAGEVWDWHDLHAIRDNLGGHYLLMNDLDSTTAGYAELASPTANEGQGWQPIGSLLDDPFRTGVVDPVDPFTGSLDGQGYEIRDLFINRPDEDGVGLLGCVGGGDIIENLGVVNAQVTGHVYVGSLVGENHEGTVSNSYSTGSVSGDDIVGGLVGYNWGEGTVSNSYSIGSVTAGGHVAGLVGWNHGTVSNSYSSGSVTGEFFAGGLVGGNSGTVSNSYSAGSVTGGVGVGGLVGENSGTVTNSHYDYDEVLINGENIITIGALFNGDFEQWLANDKFLDVNERLAQEDGYYVIDNVSDFKELLAFGQDGSLKFRLKNDLDLVSEANFYIPYLAGEFDGNGHKILNLSFSFDFVSSVGLFGYLGSGGKVSEAGVENVNVTGFLQVGGLVGFNFRGTVSNSYSTGSVSGEGGVGGLVGCNEATVSNSYSTGSVSGDGDVGGLVGLNSADTVSNSFWDTETSGQATSHGGTGKTTAEMQDIATFTDTETEGLDEAWDITAVAPGVTNTAYTWNIVDDVTYPFLSWQSVS